MAVKNDTVALQRASKALSNAKQRCTNKNNPDYPAYGGLGIQIHIANVQDLVAAIGLPSLGHSLDRIDPNGHYEIGNVRWATPGIQAANKKLSGVNFHLSLDAQIAAAKEASELRAGRKIAAVGWILVLRAYNQGHIPRDDAIWLADHLTCAGVIEAGFDVSTAYDYTNPPPSFIHLPALSLPNARVRIRCGPSVQCPASKETARMGRLAGLEYLPPEWNVPKTVWKRLSAIVGAGGAGAAFYGSPTTEDLLGGWIDGSYLAAASCFAASGFSAACYPLHRIRKMVADLPPPDFWDDEEHQLLTVDVLFIPDLSLDCGLWGDGTQISWWKIADLLRWRSECSLSTFVGVQNPVKLPAPLREIVLSQYEVIKMPGTPPHELAALPLVHQELDVPPASVTLKEIGSDKQLRRLVVHSGLVGT